jgi:hypothetical protein
MSTVQEKSGLASLTMSKLKVEKETVDMKTKLSTLWLFATLNYIYADVFTLFDKTVTIRLTSEALLGAAVLVETPMAMVLLSRLLKHGVNRWANIVVGAVNTVAVLTSLSVGTPALYNIFSVTIEAATTMAIIWLAWTWRNPARSTDSWRTLKP